MSILIEGMEMPETCTDCFACHIVEDECYCEPLDTELKLGHCGRLSACPLVPVPPHGRLIDADALKKQGYFFPCAIGSEYAIPLRALREAPTIIPAEGGE